MSFRREPADEVVAALGATKVGADGDDVSVGAEYGCSVDLAQEVADRRVGGRVLQRQRRQEDGGHCGVEALDLLHRTRVEEPDERGARVGGAHGVHAESRMARRGSAGASGTVSNTACAYELA